MSIYTPSLSLLHPPRKTMERPQGRVSGMERNRTKCNSWVSEPAPKRIPIDWRWTSRRFPLSLPFLPSPLRRPEPPLKDVWMSPPRRRRRLVRQSNTCLCSLCCRRGRHEAPLADSVYSAGYRLATSVTEVVQTCMNKS